MMIHNYIIPERGVAFAIQNPCVSLHGGDVARVCMHGDTAESLCFPYIYREVYSFCHTESLCCPCMHGEV